MEGTGGCTLRDSSVSGSKGPPDTEHSESVNLRTELQNLDAEVSRVRALLESLVERRTHVKRKLNNLISPMLRLPHEISSEIFTFYLHQNAEADSPLIYSSPFLLGKICSTWRELAWSLPSLWRSVSMDLGRDIPASYATLLDEYLSRSRSHPLSIRIKGSPRESDDSVIDIMGIIARFSERWRHIDFDLSLSCYEALRRVQGRVPILRDIVLCVQGDFLEYDTFEMFSIAPQLRAVDFINFPPGGLTLPDAQLTSFYMDSADAEEFQQALRASPQLINAMFGSLDYFEPMGPLSHVTAPCLQSLAFGASVTLLVSSLLDNLSIPAVHQLAFIAQETGPGMVEFPCMSLVSLITRSRCVLQCLSFTNFQIGVDGLVQCLRAIPSLTEFSLNCRGKLDRFTSILNPLISSTSTPGLGATPLLPNLQILKISGTRLVDCAGLYTMLSTRWRHPPSCPDSDHPAARLQSATINANVSTWTIHSPVVASLKQLVEEGMQISLVVGGSTWV